MNEQTVVAVFDSNAEAMRVREDLIKSGLSDSDVSINAESAARIPGEGHADDGGSIVGFFRHLFGADGASDADRYADAIRRGNAIVTAHVPTESQLEEIEEIMERHHAIEIDDRAAGWREPGRTDDRASRATAGDGGDRSADRARIPIVQEEMQIGKREVQRGGVRVFTRVTDQPVEKNVTLREERARVERRPADRPATEADLAALREGRTMEIRETSEEPVISKTARVVEEVDVRRDASQRTQKVRDTVRKTDVDVERIEPGKSAEDALRRSRDKNTH